MSLTIYNQSPGVILETDKFSECIYREIPNGKNKTNSEGSLNLLFPSGFPKITALPSNLISIFLAEW